MIHPENAHVTLTAMVRARRSELGTPLTVESAFNLYRTILGEKLITEILAVDFRQIIIPLEAWGG